ncbi:hypothetical protein [Sphingomonas sp. PAMC 26621]|uniref:hypothetical protein n=1 Tax=Sphingomonas sp. PAMC 26621 TaxID=1112213 RepID=UPI000289BB66|nr:hypothetical protein [Sphingomonas sp. PAMC 26621]
MTVAVFNATFTGAAASGRAREYPAMMPASVIESPDPAALVERVTRVAACAGNLPFSVLEAEVAAIHAEALACGHFPAVSVAQAISAALERGERGALVNAWLGVLRDAVLPGRPVQRMRLAS